MTPEPDAAQDIRLNRQTAVRLGRAIRNFAVSEVGGRAMALAVTLLALLFAINGLNVVNSYVGRYFMTAIEQRNTHEFVRQALLYIGVFALSTLAAVLQRFTEERLGLLWREWLTLRLVGGYLQGRMYYRVELDGTLPNPDQRIADDVRSFTTTTLSLCLIFINGALTMAAFSGVLWSISRPLFGAALGYAALGSLCAFGLGRPLVGLNYNQSDREADFRNELVYLRQHAEAVALLHREATLGIRLRKHVGALVGNLKRIIAVNRNLALFTTGYNYLIQIIPVLIVGPLFIRGEVEFGVVPQASMAFGFVLGAFSLVVNQFPTLSSYAAVLKRLTELAEASEAAGARPAGPITVAEDDTRLALERLTLRAARDGRVLVRDLSVDLRAGARLRVTAESDLALSALQRAVAGLWEHGEGNVVRPSLDRILMLTPRPFLPRGTLRDGLAGIDPTRVVADDRIWEVFRSLSVEDAARRVGGLDTVCEWYDVLSVEEQQLLGVARLLLAAPRFAVLEALAPTLGTERAAHVLATLSSQGIGYVVLGDPDVDPSCFDAVVAVATDGSWTRTEAKERRQ